MYVFVCTASVPFSAKSASVFLCGTFFHPILAVGPFPFPERGVGLKLDQPNVLSLAFK